MIDGIGKVTPGRIDPARAVEGGTAAAPARDALAGRAGQGAGVGGAVADMVRSGPPVDEARVAAIKAAIADGRYPVDADRIAERMIALDLPQPR
jgi:negative regulator of flagellin synthesis FlgM